MKKYRLRTANHAYAIVHRFIAILCADGRPVLKPVNTTEQQQAACLPILLHRWQRDITPTKLYDEINNSIYTSDLVQFVIKSDRDEILNFYQTLVNIQAWGSQTIMCR